MAKLGAGFDCASERELMEVGKASTEGGKLFDFQKKVIYANPCKSIRDVTCAHNFGAPPTVVDSYEEIDKLKRLGRRAHTHSCRRFWQLDAVLEQVRH